MTECFQIIQFLLKFLNLSGFAQRSQKKGTCFIYFPSAACLLPAQLCPEMQWESQKSSGGNPEQHCKSHGKNGTPGFGPETSETFETHKV